MSRRPSIGPARISSIAVVSVLVICLIPVASAHGAGTTSVFERWHGLVAIMGGLATVAGSVVAKRRGWVSPRVGLYAVLAGLTITTLGALLFDGLAPDPTYRVSTMPFPRAWYDDLALIAGLGIVMMSFVIGWIRWPSRPRYMFLGMLTGIWVAYPSLLPGVTSTTHPLGYAIVLCTPVLVAYIIWTDARSTLRAALGDPVARRFGVGTGMLLALYFTALSGYLTFFPVETLPHERVFAVVDVQYQLVVWSTVEVFLPGIPFFIAASIGSIVLVGMLSVLVGLNASLIAHRWRTTGIAPAATVEGTGGSATIVGSCACGCCGPIIAQFVVLIAGPSIAAPIYWVFVDSASPFSKLFLVASIVLFTAGLVYAARNESGRSRSPSRRREDVASSAR